MNKPFGFLTRTIYLVSLVSLFTDMASEMLYPIMPLYLKQIGFTVLGVGFLEGLAEAIAGLSKPYFGQQSDKLQRRLPFIQWGYALSALAKPALGMFQSAWAVFFLRSADRLGKGIRSGARDALLSDLSSPANRGKVFGFHRGMDTVGAVLGPLLALWYLAYFPNNYSGLFLLAFIPGVLALTCTWFIQEKTTTPLSTKPTFRLSFNAIQTIWENASTHYKQVLLGLILIALVNSSDMFLLLRGVELGLNEKEAILAYLLYNLVYAAFAYPMGWLADKLGFKPMLLFGFFLMALVYAGMMFPMSKFQFAVLLVLYGLYAAATEGLSKAWLSTMCHPEQKAGALGLYQGLQSISLLVASSVCGWLWYSRGSNVAFLVTVIGVLFGILLLLRVSRKN